MRRWRWNCCFNPGTKEGGRETARSVTDEDYLLPGGEWDPSLSGSTASRLSVQSRNFTKSKSRRPWTKSRNRVSTDGNGSYEPPHVPPSRTLPTFDEFRLLKTVGRGAFGKVGRASRTHPLLSLYTLPMHGLHVWYVYGALSMALLWVTLLALPLPFPVHLLNSPAHPSQLH